jgi:hypothetical protein
VKQEFVLPPEVVEGASVQGNEYAWSLEAFPEALRKACEVGVACLGGEFQFVVRGGIYEMYWLSVDPDDRGPDEAWTEFQIRSCRQTLELFNARVAETDFVQEARRWRRVRWLSGRGAKALGHLRFVADFVSEEQYEALGKIGTR